MRRVRSHGRGYCSGSYPPSQDTGAVIRSSMQHSLHLFHLLLTVLLFIYSSPPSSRRRFLTQHWKRAIPGHKPATKVPEHAVPTQRQRELPPHLTLSQQRTLSGCPGHCPATLEPRKLEHSSVEMHTPGIRLSVGATCRPPTGMVHHKRFGRGQAMLL